MSDEELRRRMKDYVEGWKIAGEYMEEERREHVRRADTARSLEALDSLFDSAVWLHPPAPDSGLIEQQAILSKARR